MPLPTAPAPAPAPAPASIGSSGVVVPRRVRFNS
jgi:hypothetical protein